MTEAPTIEVRDLKFGLSDAAPKYWHGGRRAVTLFFDNLSLFFPPGERFFIASVKAHRAFVQDKSLLEQVRAFCSQEGMHTREHVRYNALLEKQGFPARAMEARVDRLLHRVSRRADKRMQLAITAALEHFTALMAHFLLGDPRLLENADPVFAALWRWHAAEENEHKAVAFDVFRAAGGTYAKRINAMIGATFIFWAKVLEQQIRLMQADGILFSAREWASLVRFLFVDPGVLRKVIRPYFAYYRPRFHPWDLDNRDLLEAWKREFSRSAAYTGAV